MDAVSTFTSKGLVYIPKDSREKAGIGSRDSVRVISEKNKITLVRIPSLEEMKGFIKTDINKGKTLEEILEQEDEAVAQGFVEDYLKSISAE